MSLHDNDDDNGHAHDADGWSDQLDGGEDANDAIWDDATYKIMPITR